MHAAREGRVHRGVLFYTQGRASLSACYTVGTQGAQFLQSGLPKDLVEVIFCGSGEPNIMADWLYVHEIWCHTVNILSLLPVNIYAYLICTLQHSFGKRSQQLSRDCFLLWSLVLSDSIDITIIAIVILLPR